MTKRNWTRTSGPATAVRKLAEARVLLVDAEMALEQRGNRSSEEDELYGRIRVFLHGKRALEAAQ